MPESALPLSVVLATTEPWPDLARCLAILQPQVAALGGEIVVGDGVGTALDAEYAADSRCISWITTPGASVFELRARCVEAARGDIIAITEDHCHVGGDWCIQILRAFREHPAAMAVTGPVLNGSPEKLIDWANYLHTFGAFLPPRNKSQRDRCPPVANIAFRRAAFGDGPIATGDLELEVNPRLFREGLIHFDDDVIVRHVQSFGFWGTLLAHFHNGRSTTGLHPIPLSGRQLPWRLFRTTVRAFGGDDTLRPVIRRALPFVFLLSCCHALGETVGILAGPGDSPAHLR